VPVFNVTLGNSGFPYSVNEVFVLLACYSALIAI